MKGWMLAMTMLLASGHSESVRMLLVFVVFDRGCVAPLCFLLSVFSLG